MTVVRVAVIPVPRHWNPVFDRKCFILTKAYTHQIQCIYLQLSFLDSSVKHWNDKAIGCKRTVIPPQYLLA
ncbi:hypothetical protein [Wolbachia endosymbiont (group B) of Limnophora tigrina]|uniref:hypothetical protein n=1 Tax=Wolbachia endosymbiont (group B) of Limnophora tigrina TaxID=3139317 RepID=UPI0035B51D87